MSIGSIASTVAGVASSVTAKSTSASSTATTATSTGSTTSTTGTTSTTSNASQLASATGNAKVSKDQFLKLLVAQLQHQDPLSPQDPTAFVTQLAQFSALEQSTETNDQLASLTSAQAANQRIQLAGLVGHAAVAKTSTLTVQGAPATPVNLQVHLPTNANSVKVQITDSSGAIVRTIDLGSRTAGDVETNWGGLDDKGRQLAPGNYGVKVVATGSGNSTVDGYAQITGTVTSVDFGSGSTQLRVGGSPVGPGDIISVQK